MDVAALLMGAAAAAAAAGQTGVAGDGPFAVGAFRTEVASDAKVGSRKAGLFCGPAGALRWRDVEPAGAKASGAAARAIRDAGVAIQAQDADDWIETRVPTTGYRLLGDVVGVKASLCAPAYGLLGRTLDQSRKLKGGGRMRVEWRIYRLADHQVVGRTETCAAFAFDREGMAPSDVGQIGVVENARVLGAALAHLHDTSALPASLVAPGDDCPARAKGHRTPDGSAGEM